MDPPPPSAGEPTTTRSLPMDEPRPPVSADPPATVTCRECGAAVEASADRCTRCLASLARATIAMRIMFQPDQYVITLRRGERTVLGRDPELSPHAAYLSRFPNVSRRHASLSLDSDGRASIRDEYSTNWTLHRAERLVPGHERELGDGDRIRLGADLSGEVRLLAHEPPAGPDPTRSDR
ncbi:FHA domain-containing protein [Actinoplanes sp. RD1]|uniref:FHA domain-containing protein n=1 Tax=Actinoplanes sp. RD1 TaxID=3064538 RepID=UPI002741FD21|nr:FHA domain-containing protein [Actinoplanes sp. RD1]